MRTIRVSEASCAGGQQVLRVTLLDREPHRRVPDIMVATVTIAVPADAPAAYIAAQARRALRELGNAPSD